MTSRRRDGGVLLGFPDAQALDAAYVAVTEADDLLGVER
jgi:hypothetical protein